MAEKTITYDLSEINSKGSATYGFTYSGGVLTPSNKSKHNSYAYAKLTFDMPGDGFIEVRVSQSSETSCDYGLLSQIDKELSYNYNADSLAQYNARNLSGEASVTYAGVTKGTHFITAKYIKDGSVSSGSDTFNILSLTATYNDTTCVTEFDLSTLDLEIGSQHTVTVRAKGEHWVDSALSEGAVYTVVAPPDLAVPEIYINEDVLMVYEDSGLMTSYDIVVDGEVVDTVEIIRTGRILAGKYTANSVIKGYLGGSYALNYTSEGISSACVGIIQVGYGIRYVYTNGSGTVYSYSTETWNDPKYRNISIASEQEVPYEFAVWFNKNYNMVSGGSAN